MERSLKTVLLIFALLTVSAILFAQTTSENCQEDIEDQISRALETGDMSQLTTLVNGNKHKVYSMIIDLQNGSIRDELKGNLTDAENKMAKAESLAVLYNEIFGEEYLFKRVKLFQGWSKSQKEMKGEADSLRETARADYRKGR